MLWSPALMFGLLLRVGLCRQAPNKDQTHFWRLPGFSLFVLVTSFLLNSYQNHAHYLQGHTKPAALVHLPSLQSQKVSEICFRPGSLGLSQRDPADLLSSSESCLKTHFYGILVWELGLLVSRIQLSLFLIFIFFHMDNFKYLVFCLYFYFFDTLHSNKFVCPSW